MNGCSHWADGAYCGNTPTRLYQNGRYCQAHAPATLAGRTVPTPDPELTLDAMRDRARLRYTYRPADTALIDQRAVASGRRRRKSDADYRLAQAAEQDRRDRRP